MEPEDVRYTLPPLYVALMAWVPPPSADVLTEAAPALRVAVPIAVAPLKNVTVPPGVPVVVENTCAVNFTVCPKVEGFRLEPMEVVVAAFTPVPVRVL